MSCSGLRSGAEGAGGVTGSRAAGGSAGGAARSATPGPARRGVLVSRLVGAEAERRDHPAAAVRARPGPPLLVLFDQRRVVRLGVLPRFQGRAQPDPPGDLAAGPAGRAGARLVLPVDLQAVLVELVRRGAVPEDRPQFG